MYNTIYLVLTCINWLYSIKYSLCFLVKHPPFLAKCIAGRGRGLIPGVASQTAKSPKCREAGCAKVAACQSTGSLTWRWRKSWLGNDGERWLDYVRFRRCQRWFMSSVSKILFDTVCSCMLKTPKKSLKPGTGKVLEWCDVPVFCLQTRQYPRIFSNAL